MRLKSLSLLASASVMALALACGVDRANANVTVSVDPSQNWIGYMNVFDNPTYSGDSNYEFGSSWGTASLDASFNGAVATLSPNTSLDPASGSSGDPSTYWWLSSDPTSPGVKTLAASFYVENDPGAGSLSGQTVTFTGNVLSNNLVSPYTSVAFIDDFSPSYSLLNSITVPLTPGVFSISLPIGAGDVLQYGFTTTGPNARVAAAPGLGSVQVTAVPEPASFGLLALGGLATLRRKR